VTNKTPDPKVITLSQNPRDNPLRRDPHRQESPRNLDRENPRLSPHPVSDNISVTHDRPVSAHAK